LPGVGRRARAGATGPRRSEPGTCNGNEALGDTAIDRFKGRPHGGAELETRRMRAIQAPARVERLLDGLISDRQLSPKDSYQIRDPAALPSPLQKAVAEAAQQGRVWAGRASSDKTWRLLAAEVPLPRPRAH